MAEAKPTVAVHKFTSCDGCQLAFINMGEVLLQLADAVDIVHFAEVGPVNPDANVDIAFIEGSVSTPEQLEQVKAIRNSSQFLITIGACATTGGIQALRNVAKTKDWVAAIYAKPEYIETLDTSTAIAEHVKVDFEIPGCPVNSQQVLSAIKSLLHQVKPTARADSVCLECKRQGNVCVLVTQATPCMGPVTHSGCGALCPAAKRDCYACYGPKENANTASLVRQFKAFGLSEAEIQRRFQFITNNAPEFRHVPKQEH